MREELGQYNDLFKLFISHHDTFMKLITEDQERICEEEWFAGIDEKICHFKRKIHNWLKETEMERSVALSSKKSGQSRKSIASSDCRSSKASSVIQ